MGKDGWIGVDLDGTLAMYDGWKGVEHIGEPIKPMVDRVLAWLEEGKDVRIFTARVSGEDAVIALPHIQEWCLDVFGVTLPVTNIKDFGMDELWDDRAIQVIKNTGERADGRYESKPRQLDDECQALADKIWDMIATYHNAYDREPTELKVPADVLPTLCRLGQGRPDEIIDGKSNIFGLRIVLNQPELTVC